MPLTNSNSSRLRNISYYFCLATLAVLLSREGPDEAIELLEDLNTIVGQHVRYGLPRENRPLYPDWVLDRLRALYERVGRFEDALTLTPITFELFGHNVSSWDVAIRRLEGRLDQLSGSGGAAAVERCLDMIYEWLETGPESPDLEVELRQ